MQRRLEKERRLGGVVTHKSQTPGPWEASFVVGLWWGPSLSSLSPSAHALFIHTFPPERSLRASQSENLTVSAPESMDESAFKLSARACSVLGSGVEEGGWVDGGGKERRK